jgi:hypothetical protein
MDIAGRCIEVVDTGIDPSTDDAGHSLDDGGVVADAGPTSEVTVIVLRGSRPDVVPVFFSDADGAVVSEGDTNEAGEISISSDSTVACATVVDTEDRWMLYSICDLAARDTVTFDLNDYEAERRVNVQLPGPYPGAAQYIVASTCALSSATDASTPLEACGSSVLDAFAFALDEQNDTLAYTSVTGAAIFDMTLTAWRTDWRPISFTARELMGSTQFAFARAGENRPIDVGFRADGSSGVIRVAASYNASGLPLQLTVVDVLSVSGATVERRWTQTYFGPEPPSSVEATFTSVPVISSISGNRNTPERASLEWAASGQLDVVSAFVLYDGIEWDFVRSPSATEIRLLELPERHSSSRPNTASSFQYVLIIRNDENVSSWDAFRPRPFRPPVPGHDSAVRAVVSF